MLPSKLASPSPKVSSLPPAPSQSQPSRPAAQPAAARPATADFASGFTDKVARNFSALGGAHVAGADLLRFPWPGKGSAGRPGCDHPPGQDAHHGRDRQVPQPGDAGPARPGRPPVRRVEVQVPGDRRPLRQAPAGVHGRERERAEGPGPGRAPGAGGLRRLGGEERRDHPQGHRGGLRRRQPGGADRPQQGRGGRRRGARHAPGAEGRRAGDGGHPVAVRRLADRPGHPVRRPSSSRW